MSSIRNRLVLSPYTVDVYRPTQQQLAMAGYATAQWYEDRNVSPVLTGIQCIIGIDPDTETTMVLSGITQEHAKMMWLNADIRTNDVVIVHRAGGGKYDGKYFDVLRQMVADAIRPDTQYSCWLAQRQTPM